MIDKVFTETLKEKAYGHPELWECTLDEFIAKASVVLMEHRDKNKLKPKVVSLAAQFLRIEFEAKTLKGTVEYEVSRAIDGALIYFVNVAGEEI